LKNGVDVSKGGISLINDAIRLAMLTKVLRLTGLKNMLLYYCLEIDVEKFYTAVK